jgi:hypothetical protein
MTAVGWGQRWSRTRRVRGEGIKAVVGPGGAGGLGRCGGTCGGEVGGR